MSDKSFMIESLKSVADAFNSELKRYRGAMYMVEQSNFGRKPVDISLNDLDKIASEAYRNMMELKDLGISLQKIFENEVWFMGADEHTLAEVYDPDSERYYG